MPSKWVSGLVAFFGRMPLGKAKVLMLLKVPVAEL
jgi:hypothetical protein